MAFSDGGSGNQFSGGMLGNLFNQGARLSRQEEIDDEERLRKLAEMRGFGADRLATYQGADMAGKGLGTIVAAAAGKDPRTPAVRNEQAIQAAKAQVAQLGFNPDDPKSMDDFYKKVIGILQGQGLVAEAMAVAKEYHAEKLKTQEGDLKVREVGRKEAADAAKVTSDAARLELMRAKGVPEYAQLVSLAEKATDPATRQMYVDRLNMLAGKASKGVKFADAGDRIIMVDAMTGAEINTFDKGLAPKDDAKSTKADANEANGYANIKADMQRQMDKAAELHNHGGLEGITGRLGRLVGTDGAAGQVATTAASGPARAALDLHTSVVGGTLMTGLTKLKSESKTGASGLGALSEKEGSKVQADTAALDRNQDAKDLRLRLAQYVDSIIAAGKRLDAKATETGVTVVPLTQPGLAAPKGGKPGKVPMAAPAVTPVPLPTPPSGGVEWDFVDGKLVQRKK